MLGNEICLCISVVKIYVVVYKIIFFNNLFMFLYYIFCIIYNYSIFLVCFVVEKYEKIK